MSTSLTTLASIPLDTGLKQYRYRLEFIRASDGKRLDAGLMDPSWTEFWREQALFQAQRRGIIGADPSQASVHQHPEFADEADGTLKGMNLIVSNGTDSHEMHLELAAAFAAPGEAALKKMIEGKMLTSDDKATFRIYAAPMSDTANAANPGVKATIKRDPLPLLDGQLEDFLKDAEPSGEMDEKDHHILLRRELFERAREYCFKTGKQEGGAMMLARMYRQVEPEPDIFAVVHAVVELRHAKQTQFGFEPTSETFADLNTQMNLRRNRLGFPDEMPSVLVHNHPFEPSVRDDGEANCPTCPLQKECQLTSSFYSASDVNFHLSMYGRQPFVAGIVIGLTPRREDDVRMFCLEGTKTRERGFHWIK
jgi:hypothetical protein